MLKFSHLYTKCTVSETLNTQGGIFNYFFPIIEVGVLYF